jgi:hypothetical protein
MSLVGCCTRCRKKCNISLKECSLDLANKKIDADKNLHLAAKASSRATLEWKSSEK